MRIAVATVSGVMRWRVREALAIAAGERVRARGLDGEEPRHARDPAALVRLAQRLAERARVAEVAGGDHDPVRRVPGQVLQQLPHDRLLPFDAEGVDGVQEVDAEASATPPAPGAWRRRSRRGPAGRWRRRRGSATSLPSATLPAGMKTSALQARLRGVGGERRAGVAGGRAGHRARAEAHGLGDRHRHPAVLERARRVLALVLEGHARDARPARQRGPLVQARAAFGMGDDRRLGHVAAPPRGSATRRSGRRPARLPSRRVEGAHVERAREARRPLHGQEPAAVAVDARIHRPRSVDAQDRHCRRSAMLMAAPARPRPRPRPDVRAWTACRPKAACMALAQRRAPSRRRRRARRRWAPTPLMLQPSAPRVQRRPLDLGEARDERRRAAAPRSRRRATRRTRSRSPVAKPCTSAAVFAICCTHSARSHASGSSARAARVSMRTRA